MLTLLATMALMPATYGLNQGAKFNYDMTVAFDGYLPIFGGTNGTASVDMGLVVLGEKPDADGNAQASSDLTSVKVNFNGAPLPFTIDNVKPYFPKTTVSLSPQGKVLKTNAPDVNLPVRLPGLDVKRFPEISYLPVEFPAEGIEVGKSWSFKRPFGGNDVTYVVTPSKIEGDTLSLDVKMDQTYVTYEDDSGAMVATQEGAYAKVTTVLTGQGKINFDTKKGVAQSVQVDAVAKSTAEVIKSGNKSDRTLKTSLTVKLKQPGKATVQAPRSRARYIGDWQLPDWATDAIDSSERWAVGVSFRILMMFMGPRR